jgi:dipeptidyl aminopeptidase/acylaminoacyl peptidase
MTAPYGTWESPITAERVAAAGGGPGWVELVDGRVWWAESRPLDGGRVAIVHAVPGEQPTDALPPGWNARNRVHEYGGKPFTVVGASSASAGGLVFTSWDDQRLYFKDSHQPRPLTPPPDRPHGLRYADPTAARGGVEVWCVRETITGDAPTDVRRELVAVPVDGSAADDPHAVRVLAASHHFMTSPRPSPDSRRAAWIGWNHPAMPWDGTELCVAEVAGDGTFGPHRVLAGGPTEAVCQAEWDGPDSLLLITDPDGWWNLHRIDLAADGTDGTPARHNLLPVAEEFGGALWRPGLSWFAPLGNDRHAVLRAGRLAVLDEAGDTASLTDVPTGLDWWCAMLSAENGQIAGIAGGPQRELSVVAVDLSRTGATPKIVELTPQPPDLPDAALLPQPVELVFTAAGGAQVPAYVYPPTNPSYRAPQGERPPYLVHVHGGPTGRNTPALSMQIAFFTSRGFGVVAPDYGGSTGHGRAFRERLREQWGVIDVQDCAAAARALAADGVADPERLVIRGGSAGGWTVAASLTADGPPVYRCGTAMFPIIDLASWVADGDRVETHDLESHYLYSLIGPLPQARDRYLERSPISHINRMAGPILVLQGLDDQICPPAQAERLVAALDGTGIPHAYLTFDGEQHGFRKAETIAAALHAELSFYGQVFGFDPPGVKHLELSS